MLALTPRTIFRCSKAACGAVESTLEVTKRQMCWFPLVLAVVFSAAVRWLRARTPGKLCQALSLSVLPVLRQTCDLPGQRACSLLVPLTFAVFRLGHGPLDPGGANFQDDVCLRARLDTCCTLVKP